MLKKKVVCIHLFNNYSGSPKVLMQVVTALIMAGYEVDLITNRSEGFLSNISGITYRYISYKWVNSKLFTFLFFILAQLQLVAIIIKYYRDKDSILYINTITPFGAAIAGRICNKKIIYHVHEKYINPNFLHKVCQLVYQTSSCFSIFVSKYLQGSYPNKFKSSVVVYNTLEDNFKNEANHFFKSRFEKPSTILMVCSLRGFKGINEFIILSNLLIEYQFELVLSATIEEVNFLKQQNILGDNITVFENQTNLHPFYQRSKLLLNLSDPCKWVETFGLTILEAMAYGIPAIVPNVGGPIELVDDGSNGYLINPKDLDILKEKIVSIMEDTNLYNSFSKNAKLKFREFNNMKMRTEIIDIIQNM
jgi:glycosyltransferase involved in cell wall biosynthesis